VSAPVSISDWKTAPFDIKGEAVFAIGDVRCWTQLLGWHATPPGSGA